MTKFFHSLWNNGPLATAWRLRQVMQERLGKIPGCRRVFLLAEKLLRIVELRLDRPFDRKYGTDTSGVIPLKALDIGSGNTEEGIWYEPMSAKVFRQIMGHLTVNFGAFEFIDFGSGKGRVLLLAAEHGFKKVIGVEFARELHRTATENAAIHERQSGKPQNIETICMDATEFPIPEAPLVIFLYSPFKGKILERVLSNVTMSFAANPREIHLIFYGRNPESIELLKATQFRCRELDIRPDWSRLVRYRAILFSSPQAE